MHFSRPTGTATQENFRKKLLWKHWKNYRKMSMVEDTRYFKEHCWRTERGSKTTCIKEFQCSLVNNLTEDRCQTRLLYNISFNIYHKHLCSLSSLIPFLFRLLFSFFFLITCFDYFLESALSCKISSWF